MALKLIHPGCNSSTYIDENRVQRKMRISLYYPTIPPTFKPTLLSNPFLHITVSTRLQLNPIYVPFLYHYTLMHLLQLVQPNPTLRQTGYLPLLSAQILGIIALILERVLFQVHSPLLHLLPYRVHSHPTSLIPTPIVGRQIQIITNS